MISVSVDKESPVGLAYGHGDHPTRDPASVCLPGFKPDHLLRSAVNATKLRFRVLMDAVTWLLGS